MKAKPSILTAEEMRARGFGEACIKETLRRNGGDVQWSPEDIADIRKRIEAVSVPPSKQAKPKRPAKPKGMNQTERVFHEMLLQRMAAGEFVSVMYEAITLSVGEPCCRYCPDFMAVLPGGDICFYEVKGPHRWEDSTVKFKAAKKQYPFFAFEMWQRARVKDGGNWRQLL